MNLNQGIFSQDYGGSPVIDESLHFDLAFSDVVALPTSFATGTRTISTWIKPDVTTFNGQARQFFISQYTTSGKRTTYWEFRDTGVVRVYLPTTATGNGYVTIESNAGVYFNMGQWYYISVTIDSSAGSIMYIDGVAQTNTSPTTTLGFTRGGAPFQWGNWSTQTPNFSGNLKGLNLWTTARTSAEINADMTRVWTGSETGLKAYFPTNEGSGAIIQDINSTYSGTITTTSTNPNYINDVMWQ